jgi:predicted ATPase
MAIFDAVSLQNWRNFKNAEVSLRQRVFLVGANASGKSNFLDAFRFLRDLVSVGGGLQEAVRRRGGVSDIRCLAARASSDIRLSVSIEDENPSLWRYELVFNQDKQRNVTIKRESVFRDDRQILKRPNKEDEHDSARLTQTYLEQVYANQPFREIATFLASIRYLHIVPQLIREPDRSIGRSNDPYGGDFLEQIARTQPNTQRARLRRIKEALKIAVPQLEELELHRDERGTPHLRGKYRHWRATGAWLQENQFSDGTLRLMGLLWAVMDGNGPLLLEEPELSLHSAVVRILPQLLAKVQNRTGRQMLISTHSPELLIDTSIDPSEVLLLKPDVEGTSLTPLSDRGDVLELINSGISLAEIATEQTRPPNVELLPLFEIDHD